MPPNPPSGPEAIPSFPEAPAEPSPEDSSRASSSGEHVAAIEPDGAGPGPEDPRGAPEGGPETPAGLLTREQFRDGLAKCQRLAGHVAQIKTLIAAPDRPEYEPAADAAYDIIRDTPALHWLIMPGSIWLQRAVAIGAYAIPVAAGCRAELAERARAADQATDNRADA